LIPNHACLLDLFEPPVRSSVNIQTLTISRGLQNYDLLSSFIERRRAGGLKRLVEINANPARVESAARETM